jgi:hypothetical protein
LAIPGKAGRVLIQTLYPVLTFENEETTGNAERTEYQIDDTAMRSWYPRGTFTVKVGAAEVTTGFTLDYANGKIIFDEALEEGAVVTVSGSYYLVGETGIEFTDEATTANATKTRYTITDATKRYWDQNTVPVVKKDGVEVTSGYKIEYPGGVIVFDEALNTEVITVSGKYITVEQLAGFFNWSLTVNNNTIDVTTFESDEWQEFILATKNFTVSAEKFWTSDGNFLDRMGSEVILVLYTDFGTAKTRFEGYAVISTSAVSVPVDGLVNDQLNFQGKNGIYMREG